MQSPTLVGCSILIVEDQPLIAADLAMSLEEAGAQVLLVRNFGQASEHIKRATISAAIVDYGLSDEEASSFCQRLKHAGIPFVIYSGNYDAKADGGVLITKPAAPGTLLAAVVGLLTVIS